MAITNKTSAQNAKKSPALVKILMAAIFPARWRTQTDARSSLGSLCERGKQTESLAALGSWHDQARLQLDAIYCCRATGQMCCSSTICFAFELRRGGEMGRGEAMRGEDQCWVSGAWCECNALSFLLGLSELRRDQLGASGTRGISDKHERVIYWLQTWAQHHRSYQIFLQDCILLVILLALTFTRLSLLGLIGGAFQEMDAFSISERWFKYIF